MSLLNWLANFPGRTALNAQARSRRRKQSLFTIAPVAAEQFEERTLLSAAPVIDLALVAPVTYTEGTDPVVIAPHATVTDADSLTFDGGTLTATLTANASTADRVGINNQGTATGQIGILGTDVSYGGTVIGTFAGGVGATPLVITLNSDATIEAVQALQRNITFSTVGDSDVTAPRTLELVVTDAAAGNASLPVTAVINVQEAVPVVTLSRTEMRVSNSSAQALDPAVAITTAGTETIDGAVLTVTLTGATANDQLGIQNFGRSKRQLKVVDGNLVLRGTTIGTIVGGVGTTPLMITFNANATLADVQTVARNITFRSISHATHDVVAAVQFTSSDAAASLASTLTIHVTRGGRGNGNNGNHGNHGNDDGGNGHGNNGHGNHGNGNDDDDDEGDDDHGNHGHKPH